MNKHCGRAEVQKVNPSYDTEFPNIATNLMIPTIAEYADKDVAMLYTEEPFSDMPWDSETEITDRDTWRVPVIGT